MSLPRKGDIIINPKTSRPIKVGGRSWLKLVKEGVLEGRYSDPNEITNIDDEGDIEDQIRNANNDLPNGYQAVRGRGRYKGKIVKRKQQPNTAEVIRHTARTASKTFSDNYDNFSDMDDMEKELERMILAEMSNGSEPNETTPMRGRGRPRKTPKEEIYLTEDPPLFDDEPYDNTYTEYDNDEPDDINYDEPDDINYDDDENDVNDENDDYDDYEDDEEY